MLRSLAPYLAPLTSRLVTPRSPDTRFHSHLLSAFVAPSLKDPGTRFHNVYRKSDQPVFLTRRRVRLEGRGTASRRSGGGHPRTIPRLVPSLLRSGRPLQNLRHTSDPTQWIPDHHGIVFNTRGESLLTHVTGPGARTPCNRDEEGSVCASAGVAGGLLG